MTSALLSADDDPVAALEAVREGAVVLALVGNPNVGKSTAFARLTGVGVETAHYPGTTQGVNIADAMASGRRVVVVDLPGTYSLVGDAPEHVVARRALADLVPNVVLVVLDATNLARNLVLALEVLDTGLPTVVALNLADEATRGGVTIDEAALERSLGVPVVRTIAHTGVGLDLFVERALGAVDVVPPPPRYGTVLEDLLADVESAAERSGVRVGRLSARGLAVRLFEGAPELISGPAVVIAAAAADARMRAIERTGEPPAVLVARERHERADAIAAACTSAESQGRRWRKDGWSLTTSPITGVPIMLLVLGAVFGFLFVVGDVLATGFSTLWASHASPLIRSAIEAVAGAGMLADVLRWGFDAGIEASLAIGLPYILTFYVLLALLEDSGYLTSLAFLADRAMHRFGLHGRAVLPLVAAAGCNVPAMVAAKSLPSKRERLITSTLIVLVPCSARTAVVLGAVGHYIGWQPALGVFGVVLVLTVATGWGLDHMLPGHTSGLVMEMFPFRRPTLAGVLRKAWTQFREFLFVATPIVVVGSLVLGALYETGVLWRLTEPLKPVVEGWLGLPAVAGLTLILGMLRKELALQLLIAMAVVSIGAGATDLTSFMTPTNLFVYALVNTIAMPCVSTVAVLARQEGWARAGIVISFTVVVALLFGGIFARVLPLLGWA